MLNFFGGSFDFTALDLYWDWFLFARSKLIWIMQPNTIYDFVVSILFFILLNLSSFYLNHSIYDLHQSGVQSSKTISMSDCSSWNLDKVPFQLETAWKLQCLPLFPSPHWPLSSSTAPPAVTVAGGGIAPPLRQCGVARGRSSVRCSLQSRRRAPPLKSNGHPNRWWWTDGALECWSSGMWFCQIYYDCTIFFSFIL